VSGATAKQNYSSYRHDALFFNTQIATSLSACRGAWWIHWLKCSAKSRRSKLFWSSVGLIKDKNSPRGHHQEEMLKDDLQASHIPPHALLPKHNLGPLKILLGEVTYVIQDSQIGDWELAIKNLVPSNDGEAWI
jgi:hypothetical protein